MKPYHVQFDSESYFVEAECFANAIKVWKEFMSKANDEDWKEEPESVHMIHDGPVLR